jgi:hypothetical protein
LEQTLFGRRGNASRRKMPEWEYVHQELAHAGVTLSLLWNEYCESCRMEGSQPLMYTQCGLSPGRRTSVRILNGRCGPLSLPGRLRSRAIKRA